MAQTLAGVSEYIVVKHWEVDSYLKEGYMLYGDPMCIKNPDFAEVIFFQAVVKQ